jgi:hypothetical protein
MGRTEVDTEDWRLVTMHRRRQCEKDGDVLRVELEAEKWQTYH